MPLTLWLIYNPKSSNVDARRSAAVMSSWRDLIETIRQISSIPIVFSMSVLAGLAAAIVGNAHQPQIPEFARDLGYGGEGLYYSLLLGANAAGALIAGIVLEGRSMLPAKTRTSFILGMLWAVAIFGFALSPYYILSFILLVCAGFFDLSFNSMIILLADLDPMPGRSFNLDTSPDIKYQFLQNKIKKISSVIYTHEHSDQTNGLFELRPLY